ncbi:F0F1 ATP synthase subunit B [Allosphingosinicella flava]|uniref:ATP synthase subunit b n=1 Tax=Allosphingosinicella flava TaxID=2771430 RepID=A0A7T2GK13_9SPHN|nr:F0F1 ATP synthase subunit B [Sphingosinicella flava]QPQ55291.1 F0F1 ATP synthase subunit B [Sphingosinicella flava]
MVNATHPGATEVATELNTHIDGAEGEHGLPASGPEHAAGTLADEGAHGAGHAEPKALGMDATVWVSLAMIAVIAIMIWKKVPAAIGKALDRKIAHIREQLDEAAELRAEAEALKAEYEARSAQAGVEAATMLERAQHEADAIVAQAKTDAAALVERRTRMAQDKIAAAERAAIAEVRAKAANAAAAAAAALIAEAHDVAADKGLVDKAISSLRPN